MIFRACLWLIILSLSVPLSLAAQPSVTPWWLSLEQGKQKFRGGDYGGALMSFEDARRQRRSMYEQMEKNFIIFLSERDVRRLGDTLEWVERYSYERHYFAASRALEELYFRVPKTELNNSAAAALEAIGRLKDYPEAEYWIGETYRVEGELTLAMSQFRKALALSDLFEDPGYTLEIRYKIAAILRIRQEYNDFEKALLAVINEFDTLWINANRAEARAIEISKQEEGAKKQPIPYDEASASFASQAMTRTLENSGIDRFMEMYRYNNNKVERAHRILGFYYALSGRPLAQQHMMFAFLIQNTIILEEVKKRRFDSEFTSLVNLTEEIRRSAVLSSYIQEVEYYKTAYYLSDSLYRSGKLSVARSLWTFLAGVPEAGEWRDRAISQLRNPRMEPIVEMP